MIIIIASEFPVVDDIIANTVFFHIQITSITFTEQRAFDNTRFGMTTFNEREQKLMAAACQSFEGEPKFAERSGLAVGSARNAWAALKKKLYAADTTSIKGVTKTPAKSSGKKRPAPIVLPGNDNGSDDEEVSTPSKKLKTPKTMAKGRDKSQVKPPKSDDEEEEEDGFVKVKEEPLGEDFEEA
ncbi:hypothetical protein D6C91_00713 [Aureobasidium pullulans]|uniref:Uncharacterized protein n=1 Tax=Aureobasidium pullulans TaxID=5580 RepID=A0A4S9U1K3_AURPU|nr:hypothetical protein D6C91_00713 [Aureobasidium pullulans]